MPEPLIHSTAPALSKQPFRSDIAGLRALAVMTVVFYHFGVAHWSGGFVGVDIFFVISGYLMTGIIFKTWDGIGVSLTAFYVARAQRIIPGLAALTAALLLLGALRLIPPDFGELGSQAIWASFFASNFDFLREFGYFGNNRDSWLLHTWSLSVEWQFYLLYPIGLILLRRWLVSRAQRIGLVAVLFALSYLLCVVVTPFRPNAAFYLLPTRAWEMLAGALVLLIGPPASLTDRQARWLGIAGLAAIAGSLWLMSPGASWPGYRAGLPVMGAMLVIAANDQRSPVLCNRVARVIGDSSYSIYLWHWPVAVALDQLDLKRDALACAAGIAVSGLLGWLSYRYVETPGRHWFRSAGNAARLAGYAAVPVLVAAIAWPISRDGAPGRPSMRKYESAARDIRYPVFSDGWCVANEDRLNTAYDARYLGCTAGDVTASRSVLLWGDSHAGHFAPMVSLLAQQAHFRLHVASTPECASIFRTAPRQLLGINPDLCVRFRQEVQRSVHDYRWVILASRWDGATVEGDKLKLQALKETLDTLEHEGVQMIVLGQVPLFDTDVARRHVYAKLFDRHVPAHYAPDSAYAQANDAMRALVAQHPHARFVEPAALLCARSDGDCDTGLNGVFAYCDDQHLSIAGSVALAQELMRRHANFLAPGGGGAP